MIERPKYTEEEIEIIKEWGDPSDLEFDTDRLAYTGSGETRITALYLAKKRKIFLEAHGRTSSYGRDF